MDEIIDKFPDSLKSSWLNAGLPASSFPRFMDSVHQADSETNRGNSGFLKDEVMTIMLDPSILSSEKLWETPGYLAVELSGLLKMELQRNGFFLPKNDLNQLLSSKISFLVNPLIFDLMRSTGNMDVSLLEIFSKNLILKFRMNHMLCTCLFNIFIAIQRFENDKLELQQYFDIFDTRSHRPSFTF